MSSPERRAIILRGPPGVGKSAVCRVLGRHFGKSSRHINLDAYWGEHEWRYTQPDFRYADMQLAPEAVLIVELAWGEPAGLKFPGATRAAEEWLVPLKQSGRKVHLFFLTADWNDILTRLTERHGHDSHHNVLMELGRASFYEHKHPLFSYPDHLGVTEQTIDTTGKEADDVADLIYKMIKG